MARMNGRRIRIAKEHGADRREQRLVVPAWQIRASDRTRKQRVADEQVCGGAIGRSDGQADAPRAMSGRVANVNGLTPEFDRLVRLVEPIDRRLSPDVEPEHSSVRDHIVVQEEIGRVKPDGHIERRFHVFHASDVVDMGMREQNRARIHAGSAYSRNQLRRFIARVDDHGLAGRLARDHEAVLEERRDRRRD